MSIAPPPPQHLQALQLANRSRMAGSAVKRELDQGEITIAEALEDPRAGSVKIVELLAAQYRWGAWRARRLLADEMISEHKRVRELTARQRGAIARAAAQ
jgi:hypothetical protein